MSEENNQQVSNQVDDNGSASVEKEQYVPKKAFEDVSKDMHKYKSKAKEKEAYVNELESRLKQIEEQKLADEQQWKELYEKRDAEFERLESEVRERDQKYIEAVKRNHLKNELGGKIKDQYLIHADLSKIQMTDSGSVDTESLHEVANEFRNNYPELIPSETQDRSTGSAPPSNDTVGGTGGLKPLSELNFQQKKELMNNPEMLEIYKSKGLL